MLLGECISLLIYYDQNNDTTNVENTNNFSPSDNISIKNLPIILANQIETVTAYLKLYSTSLAISDKQFNPLRLHTRYLLSQDTYDELQKSKQVMFKDYKGKPEIKRFTANNTRETFPINDPERQEYWSQVVSEAPFGGPQAYSADDLKKDEDARKAIEAGRTKEYNPITTTLEIKRKEYEKQRNNEIKTANEHKYHSDLAKQRPPFNIAPAQTKYIDEEGQVHTIPTVPNPKIPYSPEGHPMPDPKASSSD
jgi:hypothetical protein